MPDPFGRSTVFVPIRALCCGDGRFTSFQEIKSVRAHQPYTRALGPAGAVGAGELHRTTRPGRPGG